MYNRVIVPLLFGARGEALARMGDRLRTSRGELVRLPPSQLATVEVDKTTLLVAETLPARTDVDVLLPMGASQFSMIPRTDSKHVDRRLILVPLGAGDSAGHSMRLALGAALTLGQRDLCVDLLFYHTTWRRDGVDDTQVRAHLDEAAERNLGLVQEAANLGRIKHDHLIELQAPTVPQGILACALKRQASLIVMARGDEVRIGSYVDQLAAISPVPLLIARKEG